MKRILIMIALLLAVPSAGSAQSDSTAYLVFTSPIHASFIVDNSRTDARPGDTVAVRPGRVVVEKIYGSRLTWTAHRFVDTLDVQAGEVLTVKFSAPMEHVIHTRPSGAAVVREGTAIGMTPYRFAHADMLEPELELLKEGFEPVRLRPRRPLETIDLVPIPNRTGAPEGPVTPLTPSLNNETLTIASGILMIASSVAAAHLKEKANRSLDEYERTRNPGALENVRRYDRLSGYASISMQVSFAGFAILLTTR